MVTPDFAAADKYLSSNIFNILDKAGMGGGCKEVTAVRQCIEYAKASMKEISDRDETIKRLKERLERNSERTRDLQNEVNQLRAATSEKVERFVCPNCGGHHFGANTMPGADEYGCHDEYGHGCHWSGPKAECFKEICEACDV